MHCKSLAVQLAIVYPSPGLAAVRRMYGLAGHTPRARDARSGIVGPTRIQESLALSMGPFYHSDPLMASHISTSIAMSAAAVFLVYADRALVVACRRRNVALPATAVAPASRPVRPPRRLVLSPSSCASTRFPLARRPLGRPPVSHVGSHINGDLLCVRVSHPPRAGLPPL